MPAMKGYRTLLFNVVMAIAAVTGHVLVPATAANLVDLVMLLGASLGNILLRLVTTTPFGKAAVEAAEQMVKLHPDVLAELAGAVTDAVQAAMVPIPATLEAQHFDPAPPGTDLVALAQHITGALATVQAVHAQMAASLVAANSQVSAALPGAVAQTDPHADIIDAHTAAPQPVPQPVPQAVLQPAPQPVAQPVPQPAPAA